MKISSLNRNIYILVISLFILSDLSLAYNTNNSNYKLQISEVADSTRLYASSNHIVESTVYSKITALSNNTNYNYCIGFYCFIKAITTKVTGNVTVPQPTQGGSICPDFYYKIYLTDKDLYVCVTSETEQKLGLVPNDYAMTLGELGRLVFMSNLPYIIIAIILVCFIFWFLFFKKKKEEDKPKQQISEEEQE